MYKDIKDVFAKHLAGTKYDNELYKKIKIFRINWSTKSDEYIEFLGGNLLGLHDIRFSSRDEDIFFNDILGIDQNELRSDIHSVKGINPSWKVSSNPLYQTIVYLMHSFLTKGTVGKNTEDALRELYYIFAYKAISSLISNGFKHKVKESVAKATYERLSNRFLLKKLGSWNAVFEYRALDVLPPNGLHVKELKRLNTDNSILITNDVQGRVRDIFKNVYGVMMEVINEDTGILSTSLNQTDSEGDTSIRDITDRPDSYVKYLMDVIDKPNDLIKDDVLTLVSTVLPNLDKEILKTTLYNLSNDLDGIKKIKDDISYSITVNLEYLNSKGYQNNYMDDILDILSMIKNYWNNSKNKNKKILRIKKDFNKVAKKYSNKKTSWILVTLVSGLILYFFLRAIVKKQN